MGSELSHPAQFLYYLKSPNADVDLISKIRWLPSLEVKNYPELVAHLQEEYDEVLADDARLKERQLQKG